MSPEMKLSAQADLHLPLSRNSCHKRAGSATISGRAHASSTHSNKRTRYSSPSSPSALDNLQNDFQKSLPSPLHAPSHAAQPRGHHIRTPNSQVAHDAQRERPKPLSPNAEHFRLLCEGERRLERQLRDMIPGQKTAYLAQLALTNEPLYRLYMSDHPADLPARCDTAAEEGVASGCAGLARARAAAGTTVEALHAVFNGWDWSTQNMVLVEPPRGPRDERDPGCEAQMMPVRRRSSRLDLLAAWARRGKCAVGLAAAPDEGPAGRGVVHQIKCAGKRLRRVGGDRRKDSAAGLGGEEGEGAKSWLHGRLVAMVR